MPDRGVFTLQEQIGCIDRQIGFQERVIEVYENDDQNELNKAKLELEILKAIRETIQDFDGRPKLPTIRRKKRTGNHHAEPF
jgi:hypothetical protein